MDFSEIVKFPVVLKIKRTLTFQAQTDADGPLFLDIFYFCTRTLRDSIL